MEFSDDDLNRILMDLSSIPSAASDHSHRQNNSTPITAKEDTPNSNEQQPTAVITNNMIDREYVLIVFNNRRWSEGLRRRRAPSTAPSAPPTTPQVVST